MAKGVPHYFRDGREHKGGVHKMPDGILKRKLESGKRKVKYVCCKVREDKTDTSCKCEEKKK
jgi:hypothetical protein